MLRVKQVNSTVIRNIASILLSLILITCIIFFGKTGIIGNVDAASGNIQVLSDLSVYSSNVEIAWDTPVEFTPTEYVIYVDGDERYRSTTNRYTFTDMAPDTSYVITVRPADAMGFLYEESNPITITTGYNNKLMVGEGETYIDIQSAVDAATPGDVIVVKDGYYSGAVRITTKHPGTESQWITLKTESSGAWLFGTISLEASYYRIEGLKTYGLREIANESELRANEAAYEIKEHEGKKYVMFYTQSGKTGISVSGSNTQVVKMEITNATGGGFYLSGENNYMARNIFRNCTTGGGINGNNLLFSENEITGVARYAFLISHGDIDVMRVFGYNNIVRNNHVTDLVQENIGTSHVDFIQIYDNNREITRNLLIEGNYVDCFLHQGIWLESGSYPGEYLVSDITIRNNVIKGFNAWAMCGYKTRNIVAENNLFIGNHAIFGSMVRGEGGQASYRNNIYVDVKVPYGTFEGAVLTDSGNNLMYKLQRTFESEVDITADPLFVNEANGDYHLQATSPAIDKGMQSVFSTDADKKLRISGSGIDIGPYEYQQAGSGIRSIVLNHTAISLGVGDTEQPVAMFYPANAGNQELMWTTDDADIATVDSTGKITGIGGGTTTITVTAKETGIFTTCVVEVEQLPGFRGLRINDETITLETGVYEYQVPLTYETETVFVTPEYASGQVTVNGKFIESGNNSATIPLALGDNLITVIYTDAAGVAETYRMNCTRDGIKYYNAKKDFSDKQGENQWYYYRCITKDNAKVLEELTWSKSKGMWTMADSLYRPWIQNDRQHTENKDLGYSVRAWKAPKDGRVTISGEAILGGRTPFDNGTVVTIKKNDSVLWTKHLYTDHMQYSHILAVDVKEGDMIYFCEDIYGSGGSYHTKWNPTIALPMADGYDIPIPGDMNNDGVVNIVDLAFVARHIDKTDESDDWESVKKADMNNDNEINIVDLSTVARLIQ